AGEELEDDRGGDEGETEGETEAHAGDGVTDAHGKTEERQDGDQDEDEETVDFLRANVERLDIDLPVNERKHDAGEDDGDERDNLAAIDLEARDGEFHLLETAGHEGGSSTSRPGSGS